MTLLTFLFPFMIIVEYRCKKYEQILFLKSAGVLTQNVCFCSCQDYFCFSSRYAVTIYTWILINMGLIKTE